MEARPGRKPFRILSLDGGGTFALIQAKVLDDLFPGEDGHQVLSHFDLVSACSGGAIVAAALIEGYSPREIFEPVRQTRSIATHFLGACPGTGVYCSCLPVLFHRRARLASVFPPTASLSSCIAYCPGWAALSLQDLHGILNDSIASLRAQRDEPAGQCPFFLLPTTSTATGRA
jgi:hypothetical protein